MMASYEALLELVQDPNLERSKAKKVIRTLDTFLRPDSGLALPSSSLESGSWEQDDSSGYSQNSSIGSYSDGWGTRIKIFGYTESAKNGFNSKFFANFSKLLSTFGVLHFEKSSNMAKL